MQVLIWDFDVHHGNGTQVELPRCMPDACRLHEMFKQRRGNLTHSLKAL